jgi:hypothetical protein
VQSAVSGVTGGATTGDKTSAASDAVPSGLSSAVADVQSAVSGVKGGATTGDKTSAASGAVPSGLSSAVASVQSAVSGVTGGATTGDKTSAASGAVPSGLSSAVAGVQSASSGVTGGAATDGFSDDKTPAATTDSTFGFAAMISYVSSAIGLTGSTSDEKAVSETTSAVASVIPEVQSAVSNEGKIAILYNVMI